MITPKAIAYPSPESQPSIIGSQTSQKTPLVTPTPSSPREFFARIYGHLESEKPKVNEQKCASVEDESARCKSASNTDSSSDFDVNDAHNSRLRLSDVKTPDDAFQEKPASAALVQLAAGSLPLQQAPPIIHRIPGFPGVSGFPGLAALPGIIPPRPPLLFAGDIPFHSGFSAFLSRRRRGSGRARRQRTTFSAAQTLRLEVEFRRAEYVGRPRRLELAAALRLSETQVKIWFQNRRAKDKRIEKAHLDHHYRALAGLPSEYYTGFASGSCGLCLYKREPCAHFLVQGTKPRDSPSSEAHCSNEKTPEQTEAIIN